MNQIEEKFSYSRVSCYLSCPYKHYLRYVERVKKAAKSRPLYFGTDFHKLLELRGDKKALKAQLKQIEEQFYELPANWQSELGDNYPDDLKTIFQDYMHQWKGTPIPDETEHSFEVKIDKGINFIGIIDELYREDDSIIIGEHKTFNLPPNMNTLVMNAQKSLYCKASQLIWGKLPTKVRWDYIKSSPAKYPVWLEKSGRFSTATSKDITPRSWARACKEHNIDDPEILKQGNQYAGNESNFFFRVEQDVYPEMVDNVFEGFVYTCKDIVKQGDTNKTKNLTKDCSWCEYRDICMAEMSGGDREYVISEKFERGN